MWSRILLPVLGVLWVVMTLLLWRIEYTGSQLAGTPVDPTIVWGRILTSLDSSSMAIVHRERRVGFCHLIPSVVKSQTLSSHTNAPEGMIREIGTYRLDLSGSMDDLVNGSRIRFDGNMTLSPDQEWDQFELQVIARPLLIEVASRRSSGVLRLKVDSPEGSTERLFLLSDLRQPESLLAEFFGPAALVTPGALPFPSPAVQLLTPYDSLKWSASTDRLMIGSSASQIYRLELKLMEGYGVSILVSRAGEILRVELPENLTLINEALSDL